jgi:hypothetical protein
VKGKTVTVKGHKRCYAAGTKQTVKENPDATKKNNVTQEKVQPKDQKNKPQTLDEKLKKLAEIEPEIAASMQKQLDNNTMNPEVLENFANGHLEKAGILDPTSASILPQFANGEINLKEFRNAADLGLITPEQFEAGSSLPYDPVKAFKEGHLSADNLNSFVEQGVISEADFEAATGESYWPLELSGKEEAYQDFMQVSNNMTVSNIRKKVKSGDLTKAEFERIVGFPFDKKRYNSKPITIEDMKTGLGDGTMSLMDIEMYEAVGMITGVEKQDIHSVLKGDEFEELSKSYEVASESFYNYAESDAQVRDAVNQYTEMAWKPINSALHEGFEGGELFTELGSSKYHTYVSLKRATEEGPRYDGLSWRGETFSSKERADIFRKKIAGGVGSIFIDPAFMSSSTELSTANTFIKASSQEWEDYGAYTFQIESAQGVAIRAVSAYGEEDEILFAPKTNFVIVGLEESVNMFGTKIYKVVLKDVSR